MISEDSFAFDPASPDIGAGLRGAAAALARAADADPIDAGEDIKRAEELIEQARNELIDWLRKDPGDPQRYHWKALLTQLNSVLPLIEETGRPGSDGRRERITQARETLESLL
jgi:hypothetical protein